MQIVINMLAGVGVLSLITIVILGIVLVKKGA